MGVKEGLLGSIFNNNDLVPHSEKPLDGSNHNINIRSRSQQPQSRFQTASST